MLGDDESRQAGVMFIMLGTVAIPLALTSMLTILSWRLIIQNMEQIKTGTGSQADRQAERDGYYCDSLSFNLKNKQKKRIHIPQNYISNHIQLLLSLDSSQFHHALSSHLHHRFLILETFTPDQFVWSRSCSLHKQQTYLKYIICSLLFCDSLSFIT